MNVASQNQPWLLTASLSTGLLSLLRRPGSAAPLPVADEPTRFDITANPGDARLTATVYFWNGTDTELPVHMESEDIRPQDEAGHVAGAKARTPSTPEKLGEAIQSDVVVPPKQKIALDFTIEVPANADPGAIGRPWWFEPLRSSRKRAAIQARVGTIVS